MSFASDNFNGTTGFTQDLTTWNSAWSKQTGYTQTGYIGADGQYAAHAGTTAYAVYQNSASPASANYSVFASIFRKSGTPAATGPQMGVCGRMQAGAGTFYAAMYLHGSTAVRLYRFDATTPTQLGTYTYTLTTTPVLLELRMETSGSDPVLSVYLEGVNGGAALISYTDTSGSKITTAGKAGLILFDMRQSGVNDTGGLDDWSAVDAGGGGSSSVPPNIITPNQGIAFASAAWRSI